MKLKSVIFFCSLFIAGAAFAADPLPPIFQDKEHPTNSIDAGVLSELWTNVCSGPQNGPLLPTDENSVIRELKFWKDIFLLFSRGPLPHSGPWAEMSAAIVITGQYDADLELLRKTADINKYEAYRRIPNYKSCGLTATEFFALNYYTGSGYEWINRELREAIYDHSDLVAVVGGAFDKLTPVTRIVRRMITRPPEWLQSLQVGQVITEPAFVSASAGLIDFPGTVVLLIQSKTGRFIPAFSVKPAEYEVLFLPNRQFRVDAIKDNEVSMTEL